MFYAIMRSAGRSKKTLVLLVDALLFAGFLVAIIGLWLLFVDQTAITAEGGARRLVSVYGSPNNVGLFLGRCLPFMLAYLLIAIDRVRRFATAIIIIPTVLALLLSQSAGAIFLGVPISTAVVIALVWRRRAILPLISLAVAGIIAFAVAVRSARFARLLDFSSGTNFARIRVWQSAMNVIRDHPFTGLGLDQFLYAFQGRYIMPDAWQEPNLSHPHNFILDFWVRLGVLGVFAFLWIQSLFWKVTLQVYRLSWQKDTIVLALAVGAMGSMANLLGHGLVDNSIYVHDLTFVFVFVLALCQNLKNVCAIDAQD
jgi:O-antigen ligase